MAKNQVEITKEMSAILDKVREKTGKKKLTNEKAIEQALLLLKDYL